MIFYNRPQAFNFKVLDYDFSGHVKVINVGNTGTTVIFERVNTDIPAAGVAYMGGQLFMDSEGWKYWEKNA